MSRESIKELLILIGILFLSLPPLVYPVARTPCRALVVDYEAIPGYIPSEKELQRVEKGRKEWADSGGSGEYSESWTRVNEEEGKDRILFREGAWYKTTLRNGFGYNEKLGVVVMALMVCGLVSLVVGFKMKVPESKDAEE